jgi:threonine dehydratase
MLKTSTLLPNINDVRAAADRIQSHIIRTPLLESPHLNAIIGGRLLVKAEPLQRTGSFKIRGAFNTLLQLSEAERVNGVLAYSSGNHAQGVACAAQTLGIKATILMPEDAPKVKIENTKSYGATVVNFNRYTESREEIGEKLAKVSGAVLVKPYDDARVIAGQGTIGLEIVEQMHELGLSPDSVVAPCGGGGLIAGLSLAIKSEFPEANIYSAEPEHYDDMALSLLAEHIVSVETKNKTICDAVMTPEPGELTFSIICELLKGGLVVTDIETRNAMRHAFNCLKLVVEPGGCVALAALLSKKIDARDNIVVVVCSGGNVDTALFSEVLIG